jgi:alpha-tubulin suppressor-like RCC1 family protein
MRCPLRVAALTGVFAILACGRSGTAPQTPAFTIGRDSTLLLDEIDSLAAVELNGPRVPAASLAWLSSAPGVASVDANGRVTAISKGFTTISASSSAGFAHISITVAPQFFVISTGETHTCGLTGRSQIYCWGMSAHGELGSATTLQQCPELGLPCSTTPVLATHMTLSNLATGAMFTCALDASSAAYCWGANFYGQLGNGSTAENATPQLVSGGHQFTQLVAGRFHACGITTAQDAYCWGWDYAGQLGAGDVSSERCTFFSLDPCSTTPRLVTGAHKWALLSATDRATCGLATTGVTYCWGLDVGGTDGLYCQTSDDLFGCTHAPIQVGSDHLFRNISIGNVHRCEQTGDEKIECWGANYFGAFGSGSLDQSNTPVQAAGGAAYLVFMASRLGACGLENSGRAQCWGNDAYGQVGNGVMKDAQLTPDDVSGGYTFDALATGGGSDHVCGITREGRALCWGLGVFGQLGNGAFLDSSTPQFVQLVAAPPPAASVIAAR